MSIGSIGSGRGALHAAERQAPKATQETMAASAKIATKTATGAAAEAKKTAETVKQVAATDNRQAVRAAAAERSANQSQNFPPYVGTKTNFVG